MLAARLTACLGVAGPAQLAGAAQSPVVQANAGPAPDDEVASPVRVRVPRLRIDARLDPLTLNKTGELRPPRYGRAGSSTAPNRVNPGLP